MPSIQITGFVPREFIDIDEICLQLLNALRAEGREIKRDLTKPTATWKHKVTFQMKISLTRVSQMGYVKVWTDDKIYGYVNNGTPPHLMGPIYPVNKKALKIPTGGSRPKTRPGRLQAYKGGAKGPYAIRRSTKQFVHPGTKPRLFTTAVVRRIERTKRFRKRLDQAIHNGLAKAAAKGTRIIR